MKRSTLKNITLSAEASLLEEARKKAQESNTTLNETFRRWLEQFVRPASSEAEYDSLMKRLSHANSGGKFTRDEMNER